MILDVVFAGEGRNTFEHLRAAFVVARIAAHEQDVDGSVLAGRKWGKLGIVSGCEIFRAASKRLQRRKDRWEITNHEIVNRQIDILEGYGMPGDRLLDASR